MTQKSKGLVILPAYNEESSIGGVLDELVKLWPADGIVVVNDGSHDGTADVVVSRNVRQLIHPTNMGYGSTVQTGILYAEKHGYDYAVLMDADGQHDPSFLNHLIAPVLAGQADLTLASRLMNPNGGRRELNIPLERWLGMKFFSTLTRLLVKKKITDTSSGMKAIHARLFPELHRIHFIDFHAEMLVYLLIKGYSVMEVPVIMRPRMAGVSMHNWTSLVVYPVKMMVGIALGILEGLSSRKSGL